MDYIVKFSIILMIKMNHASSTNKCMRLVFNFS